MKNKLLIIVCLMGVFPLCASASSTSQGFPLRQAFGQEDDGQATAKSESNKQAMTHILKKSGLARAQRNHIKEQEQKPADVQLEEKKKEQEETCTICLDPLKGEPTKTLHCSSRNPKAHDHTFHAKCINEWLETEPQCPICRTLVPADEIPQILIPKAQIDPVAQEREQQFWLAERYYKGDDEIAQDFNKAKTLYQQAIQRGAPIWMQRYAQLKLGEIYRQGGNGIAQNFAHAKEFYKKANNEDAHIWIQRCAQLQLGIIYLYGGRGITRNIAKAKKFLNEAKGPGASIEMQDAAKRALDKIPSVEQIPGLGKGRGAPESGCMIQ